MASLWFVVSVCATGAVLSLSLKYGEIEEKTSAELAAAEVK